MFPVRCLRDFGCAAALLVVFCGRARAEFSLPDKILARSISGQFIVAGAQQISALAGSPAVVTNTDFVRLEPALLAVSAERIKQSLWRELDIEPNAPQGGEIFLALHPAGKTLTPRD